MLLTHSIGAQVRTQFELEKKNSLREFELALISCLLSSGNYLAFRMRFLFIYLHVTHSIGFLDWNLCNEATRARRGR